MLIVPLPTWLLDLLLAANLSLSVTILLVVLYVPDALSIGAFPTLLLLTTLFRLGLNVSSARLILLQANAGEVIRAFGEFVVRGNYVVGAVVFLMLTIIQFVVITKGAERVAEVSARFVLDAMPGKQMAIDAELRSGAIDGNEAKRRRSALNRESQFYGAMDGAMKFVKGDVIASLIITIINIVGGLAIGVAQKDLSVGVALKKYGLLTIGDGLVSQIPALILSTAAGILVTRTASEEAGSSLGQDLARQLFSTPKAMRVASVFVVALGLVPGLPFVPFAVLGVTLFFASRAAGRVRALETKHRASTNGTPDDPFSSIMSPFALELGADWQTREGEILERFERERAAIFENLGVPLPAPALRYVDPAPSPAGATLLIHGVPAKTLALDFGSPHRATDVEALVREFSTVLRARIADFVGLHEAQKLLDTVEQFLPATVRNVVPKPVSLQTFADVLRRLLEERISIRDLRSILEALSTIGPHEKDALQLAEYVRAAQKRLITHNVTHDGGAVEVVTLDNMIEDSIRRAVTRTTAGSFLSLPPAVGRDLLEAIRRALAEAPGGAKTILTQPDIRRFVRKLIETDHPAVTVISFAELLPEVAIRETNRATLQGIG